jgi:hypothetical protein
VVVGHILAHVERDETQVGPDKRALRRAEIAAVRTWSVEERKWTGA